AVGPVETEDVGHGVLEAPSGTDVPRHGNGRTEVEVQDSVGQAAAQSDVRPEGEDLLLDETAATADLGWVEPVPLAPKALANVADLRYGGRPAIPVLAEELRRGRVERIPNRFGRARQRHVVFEQPRLEQPSRGVMQSRTDTF